MATRTEIHKVVILKKDWKGWIRGQEFRISIDPAHDINTVEYIGHNIHVNNSFNYYAGTMNHDEINETFIYTGAEVVQYWEKVA